MFHVIWLQEALDDLTEIWVQSESTLRKAITTAAHWLEQELQTDPFRLSESRIENRRVIFMSPLGVYFEVESNLVWILNVWIIS